MRKVIFILGFALSILLITTISCTDNMKVKEYGGTAEMYLQKGEKLVVMTWKDDNLWLLTKPMIDTDIAETYTFYEESSFGVWEGTYIVHEVK